DAGHCARRVDIDRDDARIGMRRANDHAMQRPRRGEISNIAPATPHKAFVFKAVEATAQERLGHGSCMERANAKGKLQRLSRTCAAACPLLPAATPSCPP